MARDDCHKKMLKLQNEQLRNNTNVLHLNEKDLELLKSQFVRNSIYFTNVMFNII